MDGVKNCSKTGKREKLTASCAATNTASPAKAATRLEKRMAEE